MKKIKVDKCFVVRAYCTDCGKMLMESAHMTKRELMINWDQAVLDAPGIVCQDCAPKRCPNFHIKLKIYHIALDKEFDPEDILPTPQNPTDLGLPDFIEKGLQTMAKE